MDLTPNQIVSANLRRIRERNHLTQATVAKLLGWSEESYAQAERAAKGRRVRRFDADDLYALARALNTTVPALLLPPPGKVVAADGSPEPPTELAQRILLLDEEAQTSIKELRKSLPSKADAQIAAVLEHRPLRRQKELAGEARELLQLATVLATELSFEASVPAGPGGPGA